VASDWNTNQSIRAVVEEGRKEEEGPEKASLFSPKGLFHSQSFFIFRARMVSTFVLVDEEGTEEEGRVVPGLKAHSLPSFDSIVMQFGLESP